MRRATTTVWRVRRTAGRVPARRLPALALLLAACALLLGACGRSTSRALSPLASSPPTSADSVPAAAPAPANLPVIVYASPPPRGFPPDPDPKSFEALTDALHPLGKLPVYDAPGGRPRAFLTPDMSGVPLTMPIVTRRSGWVAVLLPSANRTIGWLPPGGWSPVTLRDLLVVRRDTHRLTWYRDGTPKRTWSVTLGVPATPTPLGRTFIIGRSSLPGSVYAATDVFALGAVPDDRDAVPAGLRGAHIGIHTWYDDADLGRDASDGCIRLTRSGQRLLLDQVPPGTEVLVLD